MTTLAQLGSFELFLTLKAFCFFWLILVFFFAFSASLGFFWLFLLFLALSGSFLLEECNPVVLVLILTLVLVGRLPAGARGSKKLVLLAFLFSIHYLQNYEQTIILE